MEGRENRMKRHLSLVGLVLVGLVILGLGGCAFVMDLFTSATSVGTITWSDDATAYRGKDNLRFTFTLPAGGSDTGVWGTDVYTDDSSIGAAAVHAGVITFAAGGAVTIRILPGRSSYTGSTRNGVTSLDYTDWDGSFEFVTE
jgi:hypothetical protein